MTIEDKILEIEEEIQNTSYNKATQHHIGKLKAKLSQLREEAIKRSSGGGGGVGFGLKKHGDATVVLVGFPSVGKSTLLNQLTNANSEIGDYEFTTLEVIPGMMQYQEMNIQILDLPGIIGGASIGKGRGREILSMARNSNLVLIMLEAGKANRLDEILDELYQVGVRLDMKKPKVTIKKRDRGGVKVLSSLKLTKIDDKTINAVFRAYGIHNADVTVQEDIDEDRLIDAISGNRVYIPSLVLVNKVDLVSEEGLKKVEDKIKKDYILVSASKDINLEEVREGIYRKLDLMKIYMKKPGEEADLEEPLVIEKNATVGDVCDKLHGTFRKRFMYAKVWGKSAKHEGQRVGLEHVMIDGDILNIVKKR